MSKLISEEEFQGMGFEELSGYYNLLTPEQRLRSWAAIAVGQAEALHDKLHASLSFRAECKDPLCVAIRQMAADEKFTL